jgi:uncharacterized membrane protein
MTKYLIAYVGTLFAFLAIDMVWLGLIAKDYYRAGIGHLMLESPNLSAAAAFYLLYVVGIVIFAVTPAMTAGTWTKAALFGALFGFFAYATYDMTNLATLKSWPLSISIVDMMWGTCLTAAAATLGYLATTAMR